MKFRSQRKFVPKLPEASVPVQLLAKKIAAFYLRKLKGRNIHHHPWDLSQDVEDLPIFTHFVRAAKIIRASLKSDASIDWQKFVTAQFEAWNGPHGKSPLPSQLYSQGAFVRYTSWLDDRNEEDHLIVSFKRLSKTERFDAEDRYLKRIVLAQGVSERKALIRSCTEFSIKYLKHKGVWDSVKDRYIKWKEGE